MTTDKGSSESSARTFWGRVTPRTGTLLWSGITIVLLGLLIFGIAAVSAPRDSGSISKLTPSEQSDKYYDEAVVQQEQGNLDEALALAEKAVKADPDNSRAKTLVVRIRRAKGQASTESGPGSSSITSPTAESSVTVAAFTKPVKDITVLLPARIEGWVLLTPVGLGADGTVAGEPSAASVNLSRVSRALLAVHDRGTPAEAAAFVEKTIKWAYPEEGSVVSVGGTSGYFGTDGATLAAIAFARGRYAFEVVLTIPGGEPGSLKEVAENLAEAFPTRL